MIQLTPEQTASLRSWFQPEQPGSMIGPHVIQTGQGSCWVDRWPGPRTVLAEAAGNYSLTGEGQALTSADLLSLIEGFVEASEACVPILKAAYPEAKTWQRMHYVQTEAPALGNASEARVRRLVLDDAQALEGLNPGSAWVSKTWGGPSGLAQSGYGWGAFVEGRLASVAGTFFLGETYEELAVATEPRWRGLGLSTACGRALCNDIWRRDHQPSWTTSPDNLASQRVADKLGFRLQRRDVIYVVGREIP
jgi:RimJ/RimL family protein N-acetyltransferase